MPDLAWWQGTVGLLYAHWKRADPNDDMLELDGLALPNAPSSILVG